MDYLPCINSFLFNFLNYTYRWKSKSKLKETIALPENIDIIVTIIRTEIG